MTYSLPQCCLYKRAKSVNDLVTPTLLPIQKRAKRGGTYSLPQFCLYKRAKGVNDLVTPTLLPIQKKLTPTLLPIQKRAKMVKDLLTSTLLLIQKSQDSWWVTHSYTVACNREPRGWMTYTLPHCCLYKRVKRMNDLLIPTLLHTQKKPKTLNDLLTPTLLPI